MGKPSEIDNAEGCSLFEKHYICSENERAMFDIMSIMNKVKEAQGKMKEAQAKLVHLRAEGESGAGMVKVVVNGNRRVVSIQMDDSLVNVSDKEMLGDLVVAATNIAMETIDIKIKEELKSATDGMMPNIPGMDFGNMF
jgi:DNA-binding YbaB/EbfC family protein